MRVKLLKTVIVTGVDNVTPTRAGEVVEVDDAEGKEMLQNGIAEETSSKVTAEAKAAPQPENKMAEDSANKSTGTTKAAGAAKTTGR